MFSFPSAQFCSGLISTAATSSIFKWETLFFPPQHSPIYNTWQKCLISTPCWFLIKPYGTGNVGEDKDFSSLL